MVSWHTGEAAITWHYTVTWHVLVSYRVYRAPGLKWHDMLCYVIQFFKHLVSTHLVSTCDIHCYIIQRLWNTWSPHTWSPHVTCIATSYRYSGIHGIQTSGLHRCIHKPSLYTPGLHMWHHTETLEYMVSHDMTLLFHDTKMHSDTPVQLWHTCPTLAHLPNSNLLMLYQQCD